ncbi:LuxR C-terminal-related transcriptional regulator [Hymenobacter caeli]|uniref:LuxR C-terminal-related transcriptional regulator n=1 Tax=Hymenobacter caeli TaxID=2735894 RepID=UPI0036D41C73
MDDHPALTRGLAALFGQEPDLAVVGQFASGAALLAQVPAPPADVLLLALHLPPPHDGLALLPRLRRGWPALRVLVFSSATSPGLVAQVAAAGAQGFLDKSAEADALLAAIRAVHAGQVVFPAHLRPRASGPAADVLLRLHQLSAREREMAGLVREGLSTRVIADRLSLAEFTVSTHRRNLMQKLGVHGLAELVHSANEYGL